MKQKVQAAAAVEAMSTPTPVAEASPVSKSLPSVPNSSHSPSSAVGNSAARHRTPTSEDHKPSPVIDLHLHLEAKQA